MPPDESKDGIDGTILPVGYDDNTFPRCSKPTQGSSNGHNAATELGSNAPLNEKHAPAEGKVCGLAPVREPHRKGDRTD